MSFDPTSISGLIFWSRPELNGFSDGQNLSGSTDTDNSGAGHNFAFNASQSGPTYSASGINGIGCYSWPGTSAAMREECDAIATLLSGASGGAPFTIAQVVQLRSFTPGNNTDESNDQSLFMLSNYPTGSATPTHDGYFASRTNSLREDMRDDSAVEKSSIAGWTPDTSPHVVIFVWDGTNGTWWIDGTRDGSYSQATANSLTATAFFLYSHSRSDEVTKPINGLTGQVCIYSNAVSSSNIALLTTYLRDYYQLPAGTIPYDPAQGGIYNWFRDDTMYPQTNGSTLTAWAGRTQFNIDAQSFTGTPKYSRPKQNSRAMASFGGSADYVSLNGATAFGGTHTPFYIACLFMPSSTNVAMDPFSLGSTGSTNQLIRLQLNASAQYRTDMRDDAASSLKTIGPTGTYDTKCHIVQLNFDGTTLTMYVDGVSLGSVNASSLGALTLNRHTLGALVRNTDAEFFNGYIGEYFWSYTAASASQLANDVSYLAARWGLTLTTVTQRMPLIVAGPRPGDPWMLGRMPNLFPQYSPFVAPPPASGGLLLRRRRMAAASA